MDTYDRARDIIEYCLKPLDLDKTSDAYKDAYRRLEHVVKSYQKVMIAEKRPIAVDFSKMATITINEAAHGQDD